MFCSVHFVKTSTRIVKYESRVVKWSPQGHISFLSLFLLLTRNIVSPPGKYPWQELFNPPPPPPPRHSFVFLDLILPFSKCPHTHTHTHTLSRKRKGSWYCVLLNGLLFLFQDALFEGISKRNPLKPRTRMCFVNFLYQLYLFVIYG